MGKKEKREKEAKDNKEGTKAEKETEKREEKNSEEVEPEEINIGSEAANRFNRDQNTIDEERKELKKLRKDIAIELKKVTQNQKEIKYLIEKRKKRKRKEQKARQKRGEQVNELEEAIQEVNEDDRYKMRMIERYIKDASTGLDHCANGRAYLEFLLQRNEELRRECKELKEQMANEKAQLLRANFLDSNDSTLEEEEVSKINFTPELLEDIDKKLLQEGKRRSLSAAHTSRRRPPPPPEGQLRSAPPLRFTHKQLNQDGNYEKIKLEIRIAEREEMIDVEIEEELPEVVNLAERAERCHPHDAEISSLEEEIIQEAIQRSLADTRGRPTEPPEPTEPLTIVRQMYINWGKRMWKKFTNLGDIFSLSDSKHKKSRNREVYAKEEDPEEQKRLDDSFKGVPRIMPQLVIFPPSDDAILPDAPSTSHQARRHLENQQRLQADWTPATSWRRRRTPSTDIQPNLGVSSTPTSSSGRVKKRSPRHEIQVTSHSFEVHHPLDWSPTKVRRVTQVPVDTSSDTTEMDVDQTAGTSSTAEPKRCDTNHTAQMDDDEQAASTSKTKRQIDDDDNDDESTSSDDDTSYVSARVKRRCSRLKRSSSYISGYDDQYDYDEEYDSDSDSYDDDGDDDDDDDRVRSNYNEIGLKYSSRHKQNARITTDSGNNFGDSSTTAVSNTSSTEMSAENGLILHSNSSAAFSNASYSEPSI